MVIQQNTISASGAWGPGCPGYVAPPTTTPPTTTPPTTTPPTTTPGNCAAPVFQTRQASANVKFGTKAGTYALSTADAVFNVMPTVAATAFPWIGNRAVSMIVNANQYLALPFTVPANLPANYAGRFGSFDTNYLGAPPFSGAVAYSVSPCAGDFSSAVPPACKRQWNGADGEYLTFVAPEIGDAGGQLCKLERGKTYYLNIITSPLATPTTNKCANGGNCTVSMSYFRLQ